MKYLVVDTQCILCQLVFCCSECRWNHEKSVHSLIYDCPICRGNEFICRPEKLTEKILEHLVEHLPLYCKKCNKMFAMMEDFIDIDKCTSVSELLGTDQELSRGALKEVDNKFESIYDKVDNSEEESCEAIVTINRSTKTAVITPILKNNYLVDYEDTDSEVETPKTPGPTTPYPKLVPKTPKQKRADTPHVKKLMGLMRQNAVEDIDEEEIDPALLPLSDKTTPSRTENTEIPQSENQMTTPTSHVPNIAKLTLTVTTSTPTNPVVGGWSLFEEPGADSPLSEIENTGSPSQNTNNEPSKMESEHPKLKSIIVTGSRIRIGSQDSSEKQFTSQDSNTDASSVKSKRVKFAEDTVFEPEQKVKRVFRKPKRMLTPGPQRARFSHNPRFQALLNRFESQGLTRARTPVNNRQQEPETTPPVGNHVTISARAINFKEDSPTVEPDHSKESNELFKSAIDSPEVNGLNNAISTLSANVVTSLQNCINSVLRTTDEETEIQFQFVITKRKVSVKKIAGDNDGLDEKLGEVDTGTQSNRENIWSTVVRAVRSVFWSGQDNLRSETTTPMRSLNSNDSSSASKRKFEDISDPENSPLNHKRQKHEGWIRGRPPLPRYRRVTGLKTSRSAEQQTLLQKVNGSWGLPAFMCDIYIAMDVTSSTSSIFNLVAISVDRYIAVTQPIKYAKHKNNRRVWFTIVLVWLISAAIGAPIVLGLNDTPDRNFDECLFNSQNYVIYSSLGSFYIPCIMMMFLYYNIFKALRNRAKKQRAAKKPPIPGDPNTGATTAVVIENVAQTRRLAETVLHEDRPTNTGSGSNEDDHEDSFDKRSADLEVDAEDCHVIPNDKSTEFMLATVTEETSKTPTKNLKTTIPDPNGNNDSGYAPSNLEDTIREHVSPPGSPVIRDATVLQNMGCDGKWKKNGKTARVEMDSRNASLALRSEDDHEASQYDIRDGSSSKKERKASAATARFTIYKANKASKKKREKSSAKKERKATKTLAIVLGVFLFCWAPFFTCNVLDAICVKFGLAFSPGVTVFILTTWLGYINSFLNPVIYTIFNPEFRKAFRKILKCGT